MERKLVDHIHIPFPFVTLESSIIILHVYFALKKLNVLYQLEQTMIYSLSNTLWPACCGWF